MTKRRSAPNFHFYALYDKVYRRDVLEAAYAQCRANGGASGVDSQTFDDIEKYGLKRWLDELTEELALPAWLAQRAEMQQQIQSRVSANLAELDRQLTTIPTLQRLAVEGGWYAILRVPALESDEQTVLALLERGVWAHPGYFFGLPDSGWLVSSPLGYEQEFRNGLITITDYFRTNQSSKN